MPAPRATLQSKRTFPEVPVTLSATAAEPFRGLKGPAPDHALQSHCPPSWIPGQMAA
ncbi:hypothetical protein J1C49_16255 [Cognatishimia sp. F0-27]|nr:hypothetical protein [Cognatishimia sp. F0-27]